ncbi:MAG: D-hexose-6-phosphate mutarotase [Oxalobacteraceae bacterium]|nr:MAG: D-hexose-6-phosphate mutarotase [Oxalobacteraceae bacterium]
MTPIREGECLGLPALLIATPFAEAALSLHGGQLLSYTPRGFDDLLWLSPDSKRAPDAIRGGVPVCWPYFGRQAQSDTVAQHGFARNTRWTPSQVSQDAEGSLTLELELPEHASTPLRLTQLLQVGRTLRQTLVTRNASAETLSFTQALHSYFRVGDAMQVQVTGLDGLAYADKLDGATHVQSGHWDLHDPRDPGRSDRIYERTDGHFVLSDPVLGRRIGLETEGSRSLVVWNPGAKGIAAISDAPAAGWREFVCLEAANAGSDVIRLAPGQTHLLQQTIEAQAL